MNYDYFLLRVCFRYLYALISLFIHTLSALSWVAVYTFCTGKRVHIHFSFISAFLSANFLLQSVIICARGFSVQFISFDFQRAIVFFAVNLLQQPNERVKYGWTISLLTKCTSHYWVELFGFGLFFYVLHSCTFCMDHFTIHTLSSCVDVCLYLLPFFQPTFTYSLTVCFYFFPSFAYRITFICYFICSFIDGFFIVFFFFLWIQAIFLVGV